MTRFCLDMNDGRVGFADAEKTSDTVYIRRGGCFDEMVEVGSSSSRFPKIDQHGCPAIENGGGVKYAPPCVHFEITAGLPIAERLREFFERESTGSVRRFEWELKKVLPMGTVGFRFTLNRKEPKTGRFVEVKTWACSVGMKEGDSIPLISARLCDAVTNAFRRHGYSVAVSPLIDDKGEWCGVSLVDQGLNVSEVIEEILVETTWKKPGCRKSVVGKGL